MSEDEVIFEKVNSLSQLQGIIDLQRRNLPLNLSKQDIEKEGFLTLEHDKDQLSKLNEPYPHIVATRREKVIGYVLVMEKRWRDSIEILLPMFEQIDSLIERPDWGFGENYFVMGQVCVDADYRGKGVFRGLYRKLKESMSTYFDLCLTEISALNSRSINAHLGIGFRELHRHSDSSGNTWVIVLQEY